MTSSFIRLVFVVFLFMASGLAEQALAQNQAAASSQISAPVLVPHRIVYEISLSDKKSRPAQPVSMFSLTGRMVYELTGDICDGFSISHRSVTSSELSEGDVTLEDTQFASFEDPEGRAFQFVTRYSLNQKLRSTLRGSARSGPDGVQLKMKEPAEKELVFPHKVLFPSAYFRQLIAAAQSGKTIFSAYVFDGSGKVGEYSYSTASIGREKHGDQQGGLFENLKDVRHWPVTVAYFSPGENREGMTPLYEVSTVLYENGINGDLYYEFGEYALDSKVVDLTLLPESSCR